MRSERNRMGTKGMGKRISRINPTIAGRVNRSLLERAIPVIKRAVYSLPDAWETKKRGRPPYPPKIVVCLLVLGALLNLGYEQMESVLNTNAIVQKEFGIKLPSHSTYHRGAKRLSMRYLHSLNRALVRSRLLAKRTVLHVDSTGFRLKTSSSWFDIKTRKKNRRKDHLKLHALVVHKLGLIYSFAITKAYKHDSPGFPRLIAGISLIEFILCGDAGYLSRMNCKLVGNKKGFTFFKIKKNVTAKKKGVKAWYEMVTLFRTMPWGYLIIYHLRVYVESIFGAVKQRFDHQLYSRIWFMQRRELGLKVISHNVKQLLYIQEAEQSNLPLWIYENPEKGIARQHLLDSFVQYCFVRNH